MFAEDNTDNPFAGFDDVDPNGMRNPYIDIEGHYALEVQKVELKTTRKKRRYFLVEMLILESTVAERPPGMLVTYMTDIASDMGPINAKRFLAAVCGLEPNSAEAKSEITEAVALNSIHASQPLTGSKLLCEAVELEGKNGFVECRWHPLAA